ncbi:MAG: sigma-70 family RNA polymerase sigma factor [Rothia sp. (in: high G+C Gram-positive bacteria)]|nr:sigma-70 family RNA polymerase sigma factor [Rothia sp. (in: high G+C Gram-positive bacteria)]
MQTQSTTQAPQNGPTDEQLLSEVRDGQLDSFGILYERYVAMARAIAYRHTSNSTLSEDIVSEAFVRVLQALKNGKGPRAFMGGYLATTIANLAAEQGLIAQRETPSETEYLEAMGSLDESVLRLHESDELISAFTGLPERWQTVLWMTEVEDKKPREVALTMNLSANAVSALATRARESLREGFLRAHQATPKTPECAQYSPHLSSMVRGSLTKKRSEALRTHLSVCSHCTAEYLTLAGINKAMRIWVFPVLAGLTPLVTDSSKVLLPFLTGGAALGGAAATGAASGGGLFAGVRSVGRWNPGSQALAGAAAVVTAVGAVAGGLALVNNNQSGSAVISADSQLQAPSASPSAPLQEAVTDALVDAPQPAATGLSADTFREVLAPVSGSADVDLGAVANADAQPVADSQLPLLVDVLPALAETVQDLVSQVAEEASNPPAPAQPSLLALATQSSSDASVQPDPQPSTQAPLLPDADPSDPVILDPVTPSSDPSEPAPLEPSLDPTAPSPEPSPDPTDEPSPEPTVEPSPEPTVEPSDPSTDPTVPNPDSPSPDPVDPSPEPEPTESTDPADPSVEPTDPALPSPEPSDSAEPTDPTEPSPEPSDSTEPSPEPSPSEPVEESTNPTPPATPDPKDWVGSPEYYEFMAQVPWDQIGFQAEGNLMCILTYQSEEGFEGFGTYIPQVIVDSPYAYYLLESYFGIGPIYRMTCY